MNEQERENIWVTMAECFVDNEIDYDHQAAALRRYPLNTLKEIFFREVAPVCGPNLLAPVPAIWSGFDDESVVREIREMLIRRRESRLFRVRHELKVSYLRLRLGDVWSNIEQAIGRQQKSESGV
jgi:hypothetical protein